MDAHAERQQHMTDDELLFSRYQQTRVAVLDACGPDSVATPAERKATIRTHHETLRLVEQRFPGIQYSHSTAEWHLRQAIETAVDLAPAEEDSGDVVQTIPK